MEERKRLRDEGEGAPGGGAAAAAAGAAPSREELLALLAARDAQLSARDAQLAARDLQLAASEAERIAAVATAEAKRDAAVTAAMAERDAARAGAGAERAFARSLLARDATLAAALAERDEGRRLMAQPSVRAALLGERLIDVIGIVAAMGFAAEVSHCLYLCGETWRKGDKGATNDMIVRSMEKQGWAALLSAARAAKREDFARPIGGTLRGTTQLIRAEYNNDLPRVLQLVQLGASLELADASLQFSALLWACSSGHEAVAKALLNGKYEGRGAAIDRECRGYTPLSMACHQGHEGVVRLLLARGARQEVQPDQGTALHSAVFRNHSSIVTLLSAASGFAAALALRDDDGFTPLALAIHLGCAACEAILRANGAAA